jgi:GTP pyrophosphokinase
MTTAPLPSAGALQSGCHAPQVAVARERAADAPAAACVARCRMGAQPDGNPVLEPLFRPSGQPPQGRPRLLERAYLTAEKMHGTQTRKCGDPYITHPLAVTTILADIGMTEPTLAAALLHDTVEDTPYTLEQVRQDFGDGGGAAWSTA